MVETVNKLERGTLKFDVAKSLSYEAVLDLQPWSLADLYIYCARLEGNRPAWGDGITPGNADPLNLLFDLAHGTPLEPPELLQLTYYVVTGQRALLEKKVWRERLCEAVMDAFGDAFERGERLLREAIVLLGDAVVPLIIERTEEDPLRYFNSIEALGFMTSKLSWEALVRLGQREVHGIHGQIIVESVRRRLSGDRAALGPLRESVPELFAYCLHALADPTHPFTAREESLALLSRTDLTGQALPSRLRELEQDFDQLRIRPRTHPPQEFVREAVTRAEKASEELAAAVRMPRRLAGLAALLHEGVFGRERVDRLAAGMLLNSIPTAADVCRAIGAVALQTDSADYGVKRSAVRLLTKAGCVEGLDYISEMARNPISDEGLRLAVVWALGMARGAEDKLALESIGTHGSEVTRQVAKLSLRRRGFSDGAPEPAQSNPG